METPDKGKASIHQLYFGYPLEDVALLEKYRAAPVPPTKGCYTDFFGIRTRMSMFGFESTEWFEANSGMLPFPDDSFHAETIEYLACVDAVESCGDRLSVVELGAGWGPWITLCAYLGLHRRVRSIELVAVEADQRKLDMMKTHLTENGLPFDATSRHPSGALITMRCLHGGVAAKAGQIFFSVAEGVDWGGATRERADGLDYRGMDLQPVAIRALTIPEAIAGIETVDLIHVDIQGAERAAIPACIGELDSKVRAIAIGTHSRPIEGELMDLMVGHGWELRYEKPCKLTFREGVTVEGMTHLDGLQYWTNPRISRGAR